ncbi:carbon-nitrogen hydrolase family protein [Plantactinospora sp. GCM10030261]|uniref:carbon-nitrogen hydrolase family protein n=1 Tax=Plantactinospora sp. GCM10030261 TaxID=3273420 RepID=UPI0036146062
MRTPLTIAAAQPACRPYDVATNAAAHAAAVRAAGTRVVVFPEMSLTGYEFDVDPVPVDDARLDPIVRACAESGTVALVGAPVAGGSDPTGRSDPPGPSAVYIGVMAVSGTGVAVAYRKMHLGGEEPARFTPGTTPALVEVDGWRLGLAICRDTGVPAHAAATAALGIDAYVAGVLEHPADAGVPAERARRIAAAHGVWVVIASFAGRAGGRYPRSPGGSAIWRPDGAVVAEAGPAPGAVVSATLQRD